jgi:hypothetical protein
MENGIRLLDPPDRIDKVEGDVKDSQQFTKEFN